MADVISENKVSFDRNCCLLTQEMSDGSRREIYTHGKKIRSVKTVQKDGSYVKRTGSGIKTEELTSDGFLRKYDLLTGKLKEETSPQKVVTKWYDNGNTESVRDDKNGTYLSWYENGAPELHEEKNYALYMDSKGSINYELKDGRLTVNHDWFSYFRLGVKSETSPLHWDEKCTLDPSKKTLLSLGGDQTRDARAANGNINCFTAVLGLNAEEKSDMQFVSCYRPVPDARFRMLSRKGADLGRLYDEDYKREILQKFMPFMAHLADGKFERYTNEQLERNFRNIMIQAHCAGANDLPAVAKVFKETMTKLGYSAPAQKHALRQIICVTNNSQRELADDFGFTSFHRYSVKDGQFEPEYEKDYSAEYPAFADDNPYFAAQKGDKAAFIESEPDEVIMVFDRILREGSKGDEHNGAFWTTSEEDLTPAGKYQARLMKALGRFWRHNDKSLPEPADILRSIAENTQDNSLRSFVAKSLAAGKKLRSEKNSALFNHHILQSAWNKFNNPDKEADKTGVYKLLSQKYRE